MPKPLTTALPTADNGLPSPARERAALVIMLAVVATVFDGSALSLALPAIASDLQASAASSIWVIKAHQISMLALLLPLANLGDLLGYRKVFLAGSALFLLSSLAAILAPNLSTLIGARALQGVGAAGILSVNAALVRRTYPVALLGRGLALNSLIVAAASVAGPSFAATLLSVASWPWLFAINLPIGVFVLSMGRYVLPSNDASFKPSARIEPGDAVLNVLMFTLLFLGAERFAVAQNPLEGLTLLIAGTAVGFLYLSRQRQRAAPMLPLDLLGSRVFVWSLACAISAYCALMLAYIAVPFLLLHSYGFSLIRAGVLVSVWPLTIVFVAPFTGLLIGRVPDAVLGAIGMAIMAMGLGLLVVLPDAPATADIAWRMALCGIGFGLFQTPNNHAMVTSVPVHRSGAASGMMGTARLIGQAIGALLATFVFTFWEPGTQPEGPDGALGLAAVFACLGAVCSLLREGRPARKV